MVEYIVHGYLRSKPDKKISIKHCVKINNVWHKRRYYQNADPEDENQLCFDYVPLDSEFVVKEFEKMKEQ